MNRLLLRIWTGIFISIVIISTLVLVLITRYYGFFFENPNWYPISNTALLVQRIMDQTPPEQIESERAALARLLDRSIQVYSSGDDTLPEIAKQLPADGKPVYGISRDGNKYFYAPVHGERMIVAIDPSFNQYAPYINLPTYFSQLVWIFLITATAGLFLSRPINNRLTGLEAAAQKIHRGDFSARIENIASDLIGEVGTCFNQMANRLEMMISSQQTLLSGFVGKLQASNDLMRGHLERLSRNSGESDRAAMAEKLSGVLDELEQFVSKLLRSEKNSGYASTFNLNESPAPSGEENKNDFLFEETERSHPLSLLGFLRTLTGFKSSTFQMGILKFVFRVSIGILVTLLSYGCFGIIHSQFGYKYITGIENWYPARIMPALIQYIVDTADAEDAPILLADLQKNLHREIDLVDTDTLPPVEAYHEIRSGDGIKYGAYGGENVYFAPVNDGTRTLLIENGLDQYRHRPSPLLHLAMLPVELLLTIISSIILLWPITRRLKELERGLNRLRRGDLDARVRIPEGKPIGNLARSFNDMAERIQLLVTNRKHLIQAVGHEIRNPVYRIHFHLEMMLRDEDMNSITHRVDNIKEEIEELNELAEELLAFTEMENPRYQNEKVVIRKELIDIVSYYKKAIPHLSINMAGNPDDAAAIQAPPIYFRRVIQNVIANAVRHARSQISIRHGKVKESVLIEICDDGPGVPPEDRETIFEPFKRLDDSRNRKTGGHGLGLAITRRILIKYGGSVIVSDNIPCGAKFTIFWPLTKPARDS